VKNKNLTIAKTAEQETNAAVTKRKLHWQWCVAQSVCPAATAASLLLNLLVIKQANADVGNWTVLGTGPPTTLPRHFGAFIWSISKSVNLKKQKMPKSRKHDKKLRKTGA